MFFIYTQKLIAVQFIFNVYILMFTVLIMRKMIRFQMIGSHPFCFFFYYLTASNKFKLLDLIYKFWFTMTNPESFSAWTKYIFLYMKRIKSKSFATLIFHKSNKKNKMKIIESEEKLQTNERSKK